MNEPIKLLWEIYPDATIIISSDEWSDELYSKFEIVQLFERFPQLDLISGDTIVENGYIYSQVYFCFVDGAVSDPYEIHGKINLYQLEKFLEMEVRKWSIEQF